jgi:hypothetical protein
MFWYASVLFKFLSTRAIHFLYVMVRRTSETYLACQGVDPRVGFKFIPLWCSRARYSVRHAGFARMAECSPKSRVSMRNDVSCFSVNVISNCHHPKVELRPKLVGVDERINARIRRFTSSIHCIPECCMAQRTLEDVCSTKSCSWMMLSNIKYISA